MTKDEELEQLRTEKTALWEALRRKDEELEQSHQTNRDLREGLKQAIIALGSQQERVNVLEGLIDSLQERIKTLDRQQAKDSHNSSLPPSSDRFVRPPKSLRKKSGKKPGGQQGHRGYHLRQVDKPDQILIHAVERCEHCQQELHEQPAALPERRQVLDLPVKRLCCDANRMSFPVRFSTHTQLWIQDSFAHVKPHLAAWLCCFPAGPRSPPASRLRGSGRACASHLALTGCRRSSHLTF